MISWYDMRTNVYREVTDTDLDNELRRYLTEEQMQVLYKDAEWRKSYVATVFVYHNKLAVKFADEFYAEFER